MTAELKGLLDQFESRLAFVEQALSIEGGAAPAPPAAAGGGGGEDAKSVRAFDAYCRENLDPFVAACNAIGGEAVTCGQIVQDAWMAQRAFLVMASKCKKPTDTSAIQAKLGPMGEAMKAAQANVKPRTDFEFHQKTISEGLQCLSWVMIAPAPREFIENFVGGSDFWSNKIRLAFKKNTDKFDQNQHDFCTHFHNLLDKLHKEYVKEYHMAGVEWNPKGVDIKDYADGGSVAPTPPPAPAAASAGASTGMSGGAAAAESSGGGGIGALAGELGGFSTGGLKKVTKDMQTWRKEFAGGDAPAPAAAKPKPKPRTVAPKTKGAKKKEYNRARSSWLIDAHTDADGVVEVVVDNVKDSVIIYGCWNATINITGKCKGITIDSCEKTKVLFDTSISAVELVNCKRMQVQVRGTAPVINIDKTDGCLTYLSRESLDTTFTCAKSSEMNVSFPDENGDYLETPIPEQFVHKLVLGGDKPKMSADVSELYSG